MTIRESAGTGDARIADVAAALGSAFPREWAEEWDRVGLLAGDEDRRVTGVLVTLDPTAPAIGRAKSLGANVLVTHHPAALRMPEKLVPGPGPAGVLFAALEAGVALIAEHTNLDRSPEAVRLMPEKLGLRGIAPVERTVQNMSRITVYAPVESSEALVDAMAAAGAGRIGAYERCAFSSSGVGEFTPSANSRPYVGVAGQAGRAEEVRIEMVCAEGNVGSVLAAARSAHPYEEPLIVAEHVAISRGSARMGMLCEFKDGSTLEELARAVVREFAVTPRVWGEPSRRVSRCVTATGSGGSLIRDAVDAGADALVCGEVRYHDALDAAGSGLAIIEAGHDVTEWPLVGLLGSVVSSVPRLAADIVTIDRPTAGWWTP